MPPFPSPYKQHKSIGQSGTPVARALVVNVMDPLEKGRVQIRIPGHHDGIKDDKLLPWAKVAGSTYTGSLLGYTGTHGLIPGAEVYINIHGESEQDHIVTSSIPNDRSDDQQSQHPAARGKGDEDKVWNVSENSTAQKGKGSFGFKDELSKVVESTTTEEALKRQREDGRKGKRSEEPTEQARDKAPTPEQYGNRPNSKDPDGGTIGVFKGVGKDAQKFIQDNIQNLSAILPNGLDAINNLKKVTSNPTSIQSIGAGNYSAIFSQLSSWFGGGQSGSRDEETANLYDCEYLKSLDPYLLTVEQAEQLALCLLIDAALEEEQNLTS